MGTLALYGLLAVGLMGGLFLLAARFLPAGEQISAPVRDEPVWTLPPERRLTGPDIADLRLPVSLRGYRFAETDELLDRMVDELNARDTEIERLAALLIAHDISPEPPAVTEPETAVEAATPADAPDGAAAATDESAASDAEADATTGEHAG